MKPEKNLLSLILVCISLTACVTTFDTRTTQIEIMKPGIFNFPENIKTVALINSVPYSQLDQPFQYIRHSVYSTDSSTYHELQGTEFDPTIKYKDLSNTCLDALAWTLKKEGYFSQVINYHDSLSYITQSNQELFNPERLFRKTKSDLCIILDQFSFNVERLKDNGIVTNCASLSWTIAYRNDTSAYTYKQIDTLTFTSKDLPRELTDNMKIKMAVNNSATFFGQTLCSKIIPAWIPVDRMYYTSHDKDMRQAEKYVISNEWPKAAVIWSKQTESKNQMIVAKATYNMALACEMEGKPDEAINWLLKSYSIVKKNNKDYKESCQQYINILTLRKKEIEKLNLQVRNK